MSDSMKIWDFFSYAFGSLVEKDFFEVTKLATKLTSIPETDFQRIAYTGDLSGTGLSTSKMEAPVKRLADFLFYAMTKRNEHTETMLKDRLAIGIEAFRRKPADLQNTELYSSQVKAAITLTSNCILQMATGEGKTYALLPAAYALAGIFRRVYVLCANEYLAYRDAKRTRAYWDYMGLEVQYIGSTVPHDNDKWGSGIIYTTLTTLIFKALNDDLYGCPANCQIIYGAVILDEIDAALLDDYNVHCHSMPIKAGTYDWSHAISFAKELSDPEDVILEPIDLSAALTETGVSKLRSHMEREGIPVDSMGLFRIAVEYSYSALRAVEGQDYVVEHGRPHHINQLNGKIERNIDYFWLTPLSIMLGIRPDASKVTLHEVSPMVFLRQFQSLSGMSGTALQDAAEYFFDYSLPVVRIPSLRRRQKGELPDRVFKTRKAAIDNLCGEILNALSDKRPVLVGTQNLNDVRDIESVLRQTLEQAAAEGNLETCPTIRLIQGKDNEDVAQIYEHGGEVGSVIIATQISGRGVDIRLTEEAKRNGGLVLLGFERSLTLRHDKQFLGRAGRQGDPFTALFILSLEGKLMQTFGGDRITNLMNALDLEDDTPIENKMLTDAIYNAQSTVRRAEFYKRAGQLVLYEPDRVVYLGVSDWLCRLNANPNSKMFLTETFIRYAVDHFIDCNLKNGIHRNMTYEQAESLSNLLRRLLPGVENTAPKPEYLEGLSEEAVRGKIKRCILDAISAHEAYEKEELHKMQEASEHFGGSSWIDWLELSPDELAEHNKIRASLRKLTRRNSYQIAYWTIISAGINYRNFYSENRFLYYRQEDSASKIMRMIRQTALEEWGKLESGLSAEILRNLLSDRLCLDTLFVYSDNETYSYGTAHDDAYQRLWEEESVPRTDGDVLAEERLPMDLITDFLLQPHLSLEPNFSEKSLETLLLNFLRLCPIYTLQTPEQIVTALGRWKRDEITRDVTEERREINHKWIMRFLKYLSSRGVISALPTIRYYVRSVFKRTVRELQNLNSLAKLMEIASFLIAFFLLSSVVRWNPLSAASFASFFILDEIFFAGFIEKGLITGWMIPLLESVPMIGGIGVLSAKTILLLPFISVYLTFLNPVSGILQFLSRLPLYLGVTISCAFLSNLYGKIKISSNVPLFSFWCAFSLLYAFLPAMVSYGSVPLVSFCVALTYHTLLHNRLNRKKVTLLSTQITGTAVTMKTSAHKIQRFVGGDVSCTPHLYAFLATFLLSVCISNVPEQYAPATKYLCVALYCLILFILSYDVMKRRFSLDAWQKQLTSNNQVLVDVKSDSIQELNLSQILRKYRRYFFWREMLLQMVILVLCFLVSSDSTINGTICPVFLLLSFSSSWFGNHFRKIGGFFKEVLSFDGQISSKTLDFEDVTDQDIEEEKTLMQKIIDFLSPYHSAKDLVTRLLVILGVLAALNEKFGITDKLVEWLLQFLK